MDNGFETNKATPENVRGHLKTFTILCQHQLKWLRIQLDIC